MHLPAFITCLSVALQVPPPSDVSSLEQLKKAGQAIEAREVKALETLAGRLADKGQSREASEVRRALPRPRTRDGACRLMPLAEVIPARAGGLASVTSGTGNKAEKPAADRWRTELEQVRAKSAAEFFTLAGRAAGSDPPQLSAASVCLREVLARQPDHAEARRLLGYVPYRQGWARPFAVRRLKDGFVNHPVFGWVLADWAPHLDRGELPAPGSR